MFSFKWPHRGDYYEYAQYIIFNIKKENTLNYPKSAAMRFYSKGLKNKFKTPVVNKPSVFKPLKFYCINNRFITVFYSVHSFLLGHQVDSVASQYSCGSPKSTTSSSLL